MAKIARVNLTDYRTSVTKALDLIEAASKLPKDRPIIIKPNLTNSSPPPVTTPVAAVRAVYEYCRAHTNAQVVIGEGCGSGETGDIFKALGYTDLAEECGVELIDFNQAEAVLLKNDNALQLKQLYVPSIVLDAFVISLPPVLRRLVEQVEAPRPIHP